MTETTRPPAVSYVVASYNHEKYVAAFLHSVLTQTFDDLEVILVDDGSSDRTLDLARRIAADDPRLQVHAQENRGVLNARRRGLDLARAEYVSIVDSDDLLPPERTRWMVDALDRHPEAVMVYGDAWLIDEEDTRIGRFFEANPPVAGEFSVELFCRFCFVPGTSVMVRRAALLRSGPHWGPAANADYLKWIELGLLGPVICLRDKALSCWRLHGRNMSGGAWPARADTHERLRESLEQLAERQPELARRIGPARLRATYARCHFFAGYYSSRGQAWRDARARFAKAYRLAPSILNATGWISTLPLINLVSRHAYVAIGRARQGFVVTRRRHRSAE